MGQVNYQIKPMTFCKPFWMTVKDAQLSHHVQFADDFFQIIYCSVCVNHFLSTEYNDIIYNLDECRFTTFPLVIFFPAGHKICDCWGSNSGQVVHYSMHKNNRVKEPNRQIH